MLAPHRTYCPRRSFPLVLNRRMSQKGFCGRLCFARGERGRSLAGVRAAQLFHRKGRGDQKCTRSYHRSSTGRQSSHTLVGMTKLRVSSSHLALSGSVRPGADDCIRQIPSIPVARAKLLLQVLLGLIFVSTVIFLAKTLTGDMQLISDRTIMRLVTIHNYTSPEPEVLPLVPKVAYMITVTKFTSLDYMDGVAVLAHTIRESNSSFPYDLVAMVHPNASTSVPYLQRLGYRTVVTDILVKDHEFKSQTYRDTAQRSGCCGLAEFLKLEGFRLVEYKRVVVLDTDLLLASNIDDLLARDTGLLFSFDRPMGKVGDYYCTQGGFFVLRPSLEIYQRFRELIMEGDFRGSTGWKGIVGWCWGGQTIQGLMAYAAVSFMKHEAEEVDSCVVNSMGMDKNKNGDDCGSYPADKVQIFHFTACPKPWTCISAGSALCREMSRRWLKARAEVARSLGLSAVEPCVNDRYTPLFIGKHPSAEVGSLRLD